VEEGGRKWRCGRRNLAWCASCVVAGEKRKVGGGEEATHRRCFVPPQTLRAFCRTESRCSAFRSEAPRLLQ